VKAYLFLLLFLGIELSGCASIRATKQASIYFDAPDGSRVRVFEYSDQTGGFGNTDYVEFEGPVSMLVGKLRFTFACPRASVATYENKASVVVRKPGKYYLYCDENNQLLVASRSSE
jgi:uncharacterized protein YceK